MEPLRQFLKYAVASLAFLAGANAVAQDAARVDTLFERLAEADADDAPRIEAEIMSEWSRSGSDAMDLLFTRGHAALQTGDIQGALGHFTALVDHAPEFTEGYNARATAYFYAGLYGPSMADIAVVLSREPRHFGALSGMAMILETTGAPDRALDVLYALRDINPAMAGLDLRIDALEKAEEGTDI